MLALLVGTCLSVKGQSADPRKRLMFGLKAGGNYSSVYSDNDQNFQPTGKFGFAGGMYLSIPLGRLLGLQPEVMFSQKGFQAQSTYIDTNNLQNSQTNYKFTRTLNYLDVPLLIQLKPTPFVTLLGGPMYSYLLSRKDEMTSGNLTQEQQQKFYNQDIRRNTLGVMVGIDFNIDYFVISGRAAWDLQDNHTDGSSTTPTYKNFIGQITLGVRF